MKLRFVIVTFLVIALAVPATMMAQQNSKDEQQIRTLIEESRQANLKGGAEAIAFFQKSLPDDYVESPLTERF
jgi:hypothetical protein